MAISNYKILTINPGSTSTKVALFFNDHKVLERNLFHPAEEINKFNDVLEQLPLREKVVNDYLKEENIIRCGLSAVVGRGGLLKPIEGGTYIINDKMIEDLKSKEYGQHAADLGAMIALDISKECIIPAYMVNPIVVDELDDLARISGMPEIERKSIFHALNQKAVAINYSKSINKDYKDMNLIVIHLGGGISVGVHKKGRVVDVNNALNGDGPFSPERSGGLPVHDLIKLCYSGKYSQEELCKKVNGKGGLVAYLATNDARKVVENINNGDEKSKLIYEAMAYQVAKDIGAGAAVLKGQVDGIIFTGGIANDELIISLIKDRINFITDNIILMPGEKEMEALAEGALRVLSGEEKARHYQ